MNKKISNMITKMDWEEFRQTGLLLYINQILHIFGWSIVFEFDDETKELKNVYPARVKFRGFDNKSVSKSYEKISKYLKNNIDDLYEESKN
jgi:hypothetical protein